MLYFIKTLCGCIQMTKLYQYLKVLPDTQILRKTQEEKLNELRGVLMLTLCLIKLD